MSGENRTGMLGQGPETDRSEIDRCYCTGDNAPVYMKRSPSDVERKFGNKAGCRQKMGCRAGQGFRRKRAFDESSEASGAWHTPDGYYPATSQEQAEPETESFEKRMNLLKQELETIYRKLKTLRLTEDGRQ